MSTENFEELACQHRELLAEAIRVCIELEKRLDAAALADRALAREDIRIPRRPAQVSPVNVDRMQRARRVISPPQRYR